MIWPIFSACMVQPGCREKNAILAIPKVRPCEKGAFVCQSVCVCVFPDSVTPVVLLPEDNG